MRNALIVVSGLPRSGTSLMMQMLIKGGVEAVTDSHRAADSNNPKGYYEHERVKALTEGDAAWLDEHRGRAVKIVSPLLHCIPADLEADVLFMRRPLEEVLLSQRAMLERLGKQDKLSDDVLRRSFEKHLLELDLFFNTRPLMRVQNMAFHRIIDTPLEAAQEAAGFLGREMDAHAMASVVDASLFRSKAAPSS